MNQKTVYQTVSVRGNDVPIFEYVFGISNQGRKLVTSKDTTGKFDNYPLTNQDNGEKLSHYLKPSTGYFFTPEEFREVLIKAGEAALAGKGTFEDFYNQLTGAGE